MKYKVPVLLGVALAICSGCHEKKESDSVVSKRYIHKYGYAVSQEEWEAHNYPGQVITTMRDGITVTTTYEHGILHGPCTYSYPHSQTIETYMLYKNGDLIKEIRYDRNGLPTREEVRLSPTRYTLTMWYSSGTPLSIEEFTGKELVEGQYFSVNNETEARIDKGTGLRVRRDQNGLLLSRDVIQKGYMTQRESFYPNGSPESIAHYSMNKLQGERRSFSDKGEPLLIEEWKNDQLHGLATYYSNGVKMSELSYLNGIKNGLERHYIDGEILSQEITWENGNRHGPSIYYVDGQIRTEWFYDGSHVSQHRFEELAKLDEMVSQISPDVMR
ncbi:MAG: toxin-antitoxin system YwqK family antitoxin [Simkania sp.]|nr:toxin-antitoxin system YwqK family antitoxin [Simkania sp.]